MDDKAVLQMDFKAVSQLCLHRDPRHGEYRQKSKSRLIGTGFGSWDVTIPQFRANSSK
jgi:hypothetical protein